MTWSQQEVKFLIELYKEYPCLYAVKDINYKNKHARNNALQKIHGEMKVVKPNVSIPEIKSKFSNIRTNFLAEHRKYVNSLKSGMGTDEIYKPNVWYYAIMKFILEHTISRQSVDSLMSPLGSLTDHSENSLDDFQTQNSVEIQEVDMLDDEESQFFTEISGSQPTKSTINVNRVDDITRQYQQSPTSAAAARTPKTPATRKRKRYKNVEEETLKNANKVLKELSTAIAVPVAATQPRARSDSEVFGEYITKQLVAIEQDEELFLDTQHIINNVLHDARKQMIARKNKNELRF